MPGAAAGGFTARFLTAMLSQGAQGSSCQTEFCDLAHLRLQLCPGLVRHPPPQLDGLDLLGFVSRVPDLDRLRDSAALFWLQ